MAEPIWRMEWWDSYLEDWVTSEPRFYSAEAARRAAGDAFKYSPALTRTRVIHTYVVEELTAPTENPGDAAPEGS